MEYLISEAERDNVFPKQAFLTDEALLHISGHTDRHNLRK
jgi:hypothetical protein